MNQLHLIQPYLHGSWWVFDDPSRGLQREPFVGGMDDMIDILAADIPGAHQDGFAAVFSDVPFQSKRPVLMLKKVANEHGGAWYRSRINNRIMHGWLCPALLRYFDAPPEFIFVSIGPKDRHGQI